MSGSAHVTNGGSDGMMSTASFGTKLLGGESNVTFVKC